MFIINNIDRPSKRIKYAVNELDGTYWKTSKGSFIIYKKRPITELIDDDDDAIRTNIKKRCISCIHTTPFLKKCRKRISICVIIIIIILITKNNELNKLESKLNNNKLHQKPRKKNRIIPLSLIKRKY